MLLLIHHQNKLLALKKGGKSLPISAHKNIAKQLFKLALEFPNEWIFWCEQSQKDNLNLPAFPTIFHHQKMMHSFGNSNFLGSAIGFVEDSPFVKINRAVAYPTWQMNSWVGGVHATILNAVAGEIRTDKNFDYFLNSLAKLLMPLGVFCYNNPHLLTQFSGEPAAKTSAYETFRFVKQHYKTAWVFLLFLNVIYFKKKFPLAPFIVALFFKKRKLKCGSLNAIPLKSNSIVESEFNVDVVIPTLGRKDYLHQVLKDFAAQTLLPKSIIIIEQNPDLKSHSELDYLTEKSWPFQIKHFFIHQTGACNARNRALKEVTADWVFMADDDVQIEPDFLEQASKKIKEIRAEAFTVSCLQKEEEETILCPIQWKSFGSGCSIVFAKVLNKISFDEGFEHGFGEDADFGMQLRNQGVDVIYVPQPAIMHLKAPVGGFRTKPVLPWDKESIAPKPSPSVMLFYLKHRTQEQIQGYKTTLFLKYYKKQPIKNPIAYFRAFKKQWQKSVFWAKELLNKENKPDTSAANQTIGMKAVRNKT